MMRIARDLVYDCESKIIFTFAFVHMATIYTVCGVYEDTSSNVGFNTNGLWLIFRRPHVPVQTLLKAFRVNFLFVVYINEDFVTEF